MPEDRWIAKGAIRVLHHECEYSVLGVWEGLISLHRLTLNLDGEFLSVEQGSENFAIDLMERKICKTLANRYSSYQEENNDSLLIVWKKKVVFDLIARKGVGVHENMLDQYSDKEIQKLFLHYYRVTHCWKCKTPLNNYLDPECSECGWIKCSCGACRYGCSNNQPE